MKIHDKDGRIIEEIHGNGHHGPDYVGAASVRSGKGFMPNPGTTQVIRQTA